MRTGILLVILTLFAPIAAKADISLMVLEAIGIAGEYTGSGHTAIYLSNVCSEGPINLRMCRAGENGVVITSYPSFVEGASYEWMAIPLMPYLYGVEKEADIPLYANGEVRSFLRETFRRNRLSSIVRGTDDGSIPKGDWRIMLTAVFNRDVYSFNIKTSVEEDAAFLREFNKLPNEGRFNSFSRNCADFARKVLNRYFPGAARRDVINDFGITTPKAVARSFTGYVKKRPDRLFHVTRYSQVSGPIWRSFNNRNFTEMAFKSKKYLLPTLFFDPPKAAVFAAAYFLTGKFNLHGTYLENSTPRVAELKLERNRIENSRINYFAPTGSTPEKIGVQIKKEKVELLGDQATWKAYKARFLPILSDAIRRGFFQDESEVKTFFRDLEHRSEPALDGEGRLILKVNYYGQPREVGLTRGNILDLSSDREIGLKLMLVKIYANLNASDRNRTSLVEFRGDWALMRKLLSAESEVFGRVDKTRGRFLENPPTDSTKRKLEKLVVLVTR